jgi:hypothetical protein
MSIPLDRLSATCCHVLSLLTSTGLRPACVHAPVAKNKEFMYDKSCPPAYINNDPTSDDDIIYTSIVSHRKPTPPRKGKSQGVVAGTVEEEEVCGGGMPP